VKRYCVLLVGVALLVAVAACVGQAPAPPAGQPKPAPTTVEYPEIKLSEGRTVSAPAKEKSIEELLARLDAIKAQQEELEKAKKETVALVKERLKQQKERLQKLGVSAEDEPVVPQAASTSVGAVTGGALVGPATGTSSAPPAYPPVRNDENRR
jgi:hypothetical protein